MLHSCLLYVDTYSQARAKLRQAEDTSNLETADTSDESEIQKSREKRKKHVELDDDDDNSNILRFKKSQSERRDCSVQKLTLPLVPKGLHLLSKDKK